MTDTFNPLESSSKSVSEPFCQPFTVGGVVEYSRRSIWRLLSTAFLVLIAAALSVGWLVHSRWVPVLDSAVEHAPEKGHLYAGRLKWPPFAESRLANNGFLAVIVDPEDSKVSGQSADLQLELGGRELRLRSLFGYVPVPYDVSWDATFDKAVLTPHWQAWRPAFQASLAGLAALWVLFSWLGLSLVYGFALWFATIVIQRQLGLWSAFKLAGAALMAPALWMSASTLAYSLEMLSFGSFLVCAAFHVVIPWFYLTLAPLKLSRTEEEERTLFFTQSPSDGATQSSAESKPPRVRNPKGRNPFAR